MKGLVLKSTGSWHEILSETGKKYNCRIKGKLRLGNLRETNPVAVGDHVIFEEENGNGVISSVLPRKNHVLRKAIKKSVQTHVLAANIDQSILIVTLKEPRTSIGFIDRFIISSEAFGIPQILLFNKTDLLSSDELELQNQLISLYASLGINAIGISAIHPFSSTISSVLEHRCTLLAGHSGVGKSTFLNTLSPDIKQSTGSISHFSQKGIHTTTFSEMFILNQSTYIIDTPGVKEWGLVDMSPQELSDYFVEMRSLRLNCKLGPKCIHIQEPHCAIIQAVKEGKIFESRYKSYLSMILDKDNRK